MLLGLLGAAVACYHGRATTMVFTHMLESAVQTPPACPVARHVVLQLPRAVERRKLFEENRAALREIGVDLEVMQAVDGLQHAAVLQTFRDLGIRYVKQHPKQLRSFGALACSLGHLRRLLWQVRMGVPLMLAMEDDVRVVNASRFAMLVCYGGKFMQTQPMFNLVRFGYNSELYLIGLEAAKQILRSYCVRGIHDNIDDALERYEPGRNSERQRQLQRPTEGRAGAPLQAAYLPVNTLRVWNVSGSMGHGNGYIKGTGHFLNSSAIREESERWSNGRGASRAWCTDGTPAP